MPEQLSALVRFFMGAQHGIEEDVGRLQHQVELYKSYYCSVGKKMWISRNYVEESFLEE